MKKNKLLQVRLTTQEYENLLRKSKLANLQLSTYVRFILTQHEVKVELI